MSTKHKKRITKQIRVDDKVHKGLRLLAVAERITIAKKASSLLRPHTMPILRDFKKTAPSLKFFQKNYGKNSSK